MRIWIDASDPRCAERLFGMSLVERQLRSLAVAGVQPSEILVDLGEAGDEAALGLPSGLCAALPLRWLRGVGDCGARLAAAAPAGTVLALDGLAVVDPRWLVELDPPRGPLAVTAGEGDVASALLRFEDGAPADVSGDSLREVADAALARGHAKPLSLAEVDAYIPKLRRHLPPYLFRVPDAAARARAERFLFDANYKGSTDFLTRWVYPPLVWRLLRPLARARIHPNWVSALNVVITVAAVPLFAGGAWVSGLALAYAMSVLDSVDGKLARLGFSASKLGHVLDHGLDVVHPPFWYFAWAYALASGDTAAPVFQAAIALAVFYVLDRLATEAFTRRTGRSIHAYTPLDVRMRSFISRRNVNLPLFTAGLLLGLAEPAFLLIVAWQIATFAFHAQRVVQYWDGRAPLRPGA